MIKLASWNVRGLNGPDHQRAVEQVVRDHKLSFIGLVETRVSQAHIQRTQLHLLKNWSWFVDYSGPAGRIWIAWNPLEVDVVILEDGAQFIHCRAFNKRLHTRCLITVVYGDYDIIPRRDLWGTLRTLSTGISDEPCCVRDTGLVQLPFTGCPFTWHNCSEGPRSLWKRLDRMLANVAWLDAWPGSSYISALPSTSDHSPLILTGMDRIPDRAIFRFDNFLAQVQKQLTGDLTNNVKKAKLFLDKAQAMFDKYKDDIFLHLVKCCRRVYATAIKLEISTLQQRAKLRWLKYGDQNSKVFFRKINSTRVKQRVFQITTPVVLTSQRNTMLHKNLLRIFRIYLEVSTQRELDLEFLRRDLKHSITLAEATLLVAPVTHLEVKEAFFDIGEESAPGPDGYTSAFYRAAWPVVGQSMFEAVANFSERAHIPSLKVLTDTLNEFASLSGLKALARQGRRQISRVAQPEFVVCWSPPAHKISSQHLAHILGLGFHITQRCTEAAGKRMRAFLWQGFFWKRKCESGLGSALQTKGEGGLGIRSLIVTNQALILKQLWRILQNDGTSIWVAWIQQYRLRRTTIWTFNSAAGSWGWKKMLKLRPILQRGVTYKVGDGSIFSLWQDIWHIRGPLCLNFPRGPEVTGLPLHSILSSVLQHNHWTWPASTDSDITEIMSQLPPIFPSAADTICWNSTSGSFTIKSAILLFQPQQCGFIGMAFFKTHVQFQWPYLEWQRGITWASKKWRGDHLVNAALRATLAALVYRIWAERNNRKFTATASSAEITSNKVLEDVRLRILTSDISPSLQARILYRIWNLHGHSGNANLV
ncbi:UNVERIFIED_CONTAM: hypothetical protein Scaly_2901700 [Sesamum calycinum]|uniref:Uncharacterized protein n=1 Tax=Sesamum calycinum TaxID=2727403 RepID=A0AAW2L3E7_9LAMI